MKNVEPKAESAIEKVASTYSKAWQAVNTAPNPTVKSKAVFALNSIPLSISWCAQVTVTPEDSSKIVFRRGTPMGLKGVIP